MTKQQLQSQYDVKSFVEHPAFLPVLVYLSAQEETVGAGRDATTIINDEGVKRGREQMIKKLREVAAITSNHETKSVPPYSEPHK